MCCLLCLSHEYSYQCTGHSPTQDTALHRTQPYTGHRPTQDTALHRTQDTAHNCKVVKVTVSVLLEK